MDWLHQLPIAHRGLHDADRPENTLAAFRAACAAGYAIELDVQRSADGQPIVFHDAMLEQLTGRPGAVAATTAVQLTKLSVLGSAECIPLLTDVLNLVRGAVPLLIEIKNIGGRRAIGPLEQAVATVLRHYNGPFAVQSFNPYVLGWLRRHAPEMARGQLAGDFAGEDVPPVRRLVLQHLLMNWHSRPHFIGYDARRLPYRPVARARRRGLPILAWTVRSAAEQARLRPHVDNIIFEGFLPPLRNR